MSDPQFDYALDPTGSLAANKIVQESHTITAINDRNYNFIIPKFAPFFLDSIRVFIAEGNNLLPLAKDTGWYPALQFTGASLAIGTPVYGAISLVDLNFGGNIVIEYQTLGGQYTLAQDKLTELMANIIYNPRGSTWEEITGLPGMFPPIDHPWDFSDMVGMTEIKESLNQIEAAIIGKTGTDITAHIQNLLNPHQVSKNQLGLNLVENFPPSTILQALTGQNNSSVLTPLVLRAVLSELGLIELSALIAEMRTHINNKINPHNVTKDQVGLSEVENLSVATATDILARRRVRKYVTLDQMMDYLSLYGCKPVENADISFPPKDALLSAYCANLNRMGVYADGLGGSYEKIIELNSRDCGYVPASPTQFPQQGTILSKYCIGVDQFAIHADGMGGTLQRIFRMNSPDCGYTGPGTPGTYPAAGTILSTRCEGKTLVKVVANGSGGSTEQREENSNQCSTPSPTNPPADTLLSTYCQGFDLRGRYADGAGGQYTAIVTRNSTECGYVAPTPPPNNPPPTNPPPNNPPPTNPPPNNPPPNTSNPTISISLNTGSIGVGQRASLTANIGSLTTGKSYTVVFYRTNSVGSWEQYYNSTSFTANSSSTSMSFNVDNNGDVVSGSYKFKASIEESGKSKIESNQATLNYTANKTISLTIDGSSTQLTRYVGNNVVVRYEFRDFPITGSAAETQQIYYYLEIRGADNRNAGENQFSTTTNSVGAATQEFTSTLLANAEITGNVSYRIVATWKEFGGGMRTTYSNYVNVTWVKAATPPPNNPPPPGATYQVHDAGEIKNWWMTAHVASRNGLRFNINGNISSPWGDKNQLRYFTIRYNSSGSKVVWSNNAAGLTTPIGSMDVYLSSYYDTVSRSVGGTDGMRNFGPKFGWAALTKAGIVTASNDTITLNSVVINQDGSFSADITITSNDSGGGG